MTRANYWTRTIGRRSVLRSAGIGIAGLGGAALIGCGSNNSSEKTPASGTATAASSATKSGTAAAEKPRSGGILKNAARPDTSKLDPSIDSSLATLLAGSTMYSQLVRYDPYKLPDERVIVPDLAEKWEAANGAQSFAFTLRKGVTFHDGKPVTSADVAATFERAKKVHPARDLLRPITGVETPDDVTVVFKTSAPTGYLVELLASPMSAIMPKHIITVSNGESLKEKPVGTGPFMFDAWQKGVAIKVKKNPNYFLKGMPYLDGVDFIQTADIAAEINGLRTGQIHVSQQSAHITEDALKQIKADVPNILVRHPGSTTTDDMFINNTKAPFTDVRVRRAMNNVIDQQKMVDLLRGGEGQPIGYILGSGLSAAERTKGIPGYGGIKDANIAEAKKLMDAAGFKGGFTTDFKIGRSVASEADNFITVYGQQLAQIGIKLTPVKQKYPDEIFRTLDKLDYSIGQTSWIFAMINPVAFLQVMVTGNAGNRTGYSNPAYDALFKKLIATGDQKEIQSLAVQMENILVQDVPYVIGWGLRYNNVIRPEVGGYTGPAYLRDYFDLVQVYLKG